MKIAIIGLGKMGEQIARKLHENNFTVIANNRSTQVIDDMKSLGMTGAYSKEEVIQAFGNDKIILWLMIPSDTVDQN